MCFLILFSSRSIDQDLKKVDQQTILDDFNKHNLAITQPSTAPPVAPQLPSAASPSPAVANSTVRFIATREGVLTRAAALGRGAATTGCKRFLALTEAAKDRKDGPFRKLFDTRDLLKTVHVYQGKKIDTSVSFPLHMPDPATK